MKKILLILSLFFAFSTKSQTLDWAKQIGNATTSTSNNIASDAAGNIYILGGFQLSPDFDSGAGVQTLSSFANSEDVFLAKYDNAGNFLWVKQMGGSFTDRATTLAVDPSGNAYCYGTFASTASFGSTVLDVAQGEVFLTKIDPSGNFEWTGQLKTHFPRTIDFIGSDILISGQSYATTTDFDMGAGVSNQTFTGYIGQYIARYTTAGALVWAKIFTGPASTEAQNAINSVYVDATENIYSVNKFKGAIDFDPNAGSNILTAIGTDLETGFFKLNGAGVLQWAKQFGGSTQGISGTITPDHLGNLQITGTLEGTADMDPGAGITNLTSVNYKAIYLSIFDINGNFISTRKIDGPASASDYIYQWNSYFKANGKNVVELNVSGNYDLGDGVQYYPSVNVIACYDASNNLLWKEVMPFYSSGTYSESGSNMLTVGTLNNNGSNFDVDPQGGPTHVQNINNAAGQIFFRKSSVDAPPVFLPTLVAHYPFNGNANDATGNAANNGTVSGATLTTDRFGYPNAAYNFDGADDYIEAVADNMPIGDRTISLWFNADAGSIASNTPAALSYGGGACGTSLLMILNNINNAKYHVSGHCNTNLNEFAYASLPENNWYNWVVTINNNTIKMFINGVLINTTSNFGTPTTVAGKDFFIGALINNNGLGRLYPSGNYYFKGKLDDIKIFDGALTDAQVLDLYTPFSLVAHYPFNGNPDDVIGNAHGTAINGPLLTEDRFGNPNAAYYFDGTNDYIEAAADNLPTENSTVSLWFKADAGSMATNPGMFGYGGNGGACPGNSHILQLYQSSGINSFVSHAHCGTNQIFYNSPEIPEEKWYNWVVTTSGTTIKMYLNGKLVSTSNANTNPKIVVGKKLNLGAVVSLSGTSNYTDGNVGRFKGVLDDVKIYNGVLPASEIFDNYIKDQTMAGSGKVLTFSGSQYVEASDTQDFTFGNTFSTSAWIKTTSFDADIFSNFEAGFPFVGTLFGVGFGCVGNNADPRAGKLGFYIGNTSPTVSESYNDLSGPRVDDNKWHHVAVTYNGSHVIFYVDGIKTSTIAANNNPIGNSTNKLRIGRDNNEPGIRYFNGNIDELQLWKAAITETEIRDWMCKKVTSDHPQFSNLVAYFKFDEGLGAKTGGFGGSFGSLINTPTWHTSGAAIGDDSDHDYTHTIKSALISHTTGESFLVESISGDPAGVQVYRVDQAPSNLAGHNGLDPFPTYYGVFQTGGTNPTYTATYTYFGNNVGGAEANLRLYSRANNAATSWTENSTLPDMPNDKIVLTGQSTEYILGATLSPLPLNLISFTGKNENSQNILNWLTDNEVALSHFEIERGPEASVALTPGGGITNLNFEKIGEIKANGGPSEKVEYEFIDQAPPAPNGGAFYRLKMVDLDGKFKYSKIISIINREQSPPLEVGGLYPNPTTDYFSISGNKPFEILQIVDMTGRLVKEFLPQNGNKYSLNGLSKGVYLVKLIGNKSLITKKLIIK